jgi:acetolactate synthase-1/2/3 large subunit
LCETFPAVLQRGAGLPSVERLAYFSEMAERQLAGTRHLVLAGAPSPVSFFAYPDKAGDLVPDGCLVHRLAAPGEDVSRALEDLADAVGASSFEAAVQPSGRPDRPSGALNAAAVGAAVGALLPDGSIVCDEANTSGGFVLSATADAPRHDWLCLTGGAIGQGLPLATGAAVARPDRKVLCLEADGSAMYTLQALWTQAREGLDVTTVIFNNRSYAILAIELGRVGAAASGPRALDMFDLGRPPLDFVSLAAGMGVPASRATTAEEFSTQLERALAEPGPALVEAVI